VWLEIQARACGSKSKLERVARNPSSSVWLEIQDRLHLSEIGQPELSIGAKIPPPSGGFRVLLRGLPFTCVVAG